MENDITVRKRYKEKMLDRIFELKRTEQMFRYF